MTLYMISDHEISKVDLKLICHLKNELQNNYIKDEYVAN